MAIIVKCPECDLALKVAEESVGKKIRCKKCEHVFVAKAPSAKAAKAGKGGKEKEKEKAKAEPKAEPKKPSLLDEEGGPKNYGVTDTELGARCPECANEMDEKDKVCLYCGFNTVTRTRVRMRKVKEITGMQIFLWLVPGILCVFGVIGLFTFCILWSINADAWTKDQWYEFTAHYGVKIWMWIISLWAIYTMSRFAIKRLIIQPKPDEVELR